MGERPESDAGTRAQILADLATAFAEAVTDEDRLLQLVVERIGAFTADACVIRLFDADHVPRAVAYYHPDPQLRERIRAVAVATNPDPRLGVWRQLLEDRRVVRLAIEPERLPEGMTPAQGWFLAGKPVRHFLGVPLIARGRVLGGILVVRCLRGEAYTDADVDFLRDLGERAALAIDNARLYTAERTARARAEAAEEALRADLVERVRVEEASRRAEAIQTLNVRLEARTRELVAANEELEAFAYSVSHDLRAPLRAIDGFSQALLEDQGAVLDETGHAHLRRVRLGVARMRELIDDMLALSRSTRVVIEPATVDLTAIASGVVAELRAQDPTRVVEVQLSVSCEVQGDPRMLRIVIENMLGNAWKFTRNRSPAHIALECACTREEAIVTVRDDGAGFDMAYARRLFQPFQRLHSTEEFEGTGIGLAIVRRIVHRHGGRVWAEGEPGVGAAFHFALPRMHVVPRPDV
jgi:signal transduction histidine kinase